MKNEENNPLNNNDNQGEEHHSQENLNSDNIDRIGVEAKKPNVTNTSGVRDTKQKEEDQKISKIIFLKYSIVKGEIEFMRPNSLFIYHSLLTFDRIFTCFYAILEWALFIFKGYNFPIERNSISVEIVCILFYFSINLLRIYCGEFGNRSETSLFVILSIAFVVGAFYTYFFFIFMSTYVLHLEIIINSFGLCLSFIETIFGVIAVIRIMGQEVSL